MISDSGTSDESNSSTTDILIKESRNPVKRLRRQLEELQVKSPIISVKCMGPGYNGTKSQENSAEV